MAKRKSSGKEVNERPLGSIRATISFPSDVYEALEEIAKQKKVSLAWVVRDATEQYVTDKWPLFRAGKGRNG